MLHGSIVRNINVIRTLIIIKLQRKIYSKKNISEKLLRKSSVVRKLIDKKFNPCNTVDPDIFIKVIMDNEYFIPDDDYTIIEE